MIPTHAHFGIKERTTIASYVQYVASPGAVAFQLYIGVMSSVTSGADSNRSVSSSSKPWFLTMNPETKDVLIWKSGIRLKLSDGTSTGRVMSAAVSKRHAGSITFTGAVVDGSRRFHFTCNLSKFVASVNDFTQGLAPYADDPARFTTKLSSVTEGGIVVTEDNRKRHQEAESDTEPNPKKSKKSSDATHVLQQEIAKEHIGLYTLQVSHLKDPSPNYQIRDVKEWYVEYLATLLSDKDSDHEELTAPLLVIASVNASEFQHRHVEKYTYEVIGGIQRFAAIKKINEQGARMILTRKCVVYGNALSASSVLFLARQHNDYNQIQRVTSFPEVAACCRRLLFSHFGENLADDECVSLEIPRYNSQPYREYKQQCVSFIASSQISIPMVEQGIQMANQPSAVYHRMQRVFTLFEGGKLKGQTVHKMVGVTLQKALEGRLAPKLPQFKIFQGLKDEEKIELLDRLIGKEITFVEAEKLCLEKKAQQAARSAFLKLVGIEKWDDAVRSLPGFARDEALERFKIQRGKTLPEGFKVFCERARAVKTKVAPPPTKKYGCVTIVVADEDRITHIDFKSISLVFMDMQCVFSMTVAEKLLNVISLNREQPWMIVLYNQSGALTSAELEVKCSEIGAENTRIITICSVEKAEESVQLGSCMEVIVAWWDQYNHPLCRDITKTNAIICSPEDEDTVASTQATGWIHYVVRNSPQDAVADVFSATGEVAQICSQDGIPCLCVQKRASAAEEIAAVLQEGGGGGEFDGGNVGGASEVAAVLQEGGGDGELDGGNVGRASEVAAVLQEEGGEGEFDGGNVGGANEGDGDGDNDKRLTKSVDTQKLIEELSLLAKSDSCGNVPDEQQLPKKTLGTRTTRSKTRSMAQK